MNADKLAATAIIKNLPWANQFSSEMISEFINQIALTDPTRIIWHAKRLQGFGCSELGGLVCDYLKLFEDAPYKAAPYSFSDARTVIQSKLLKIATLENNGNIDRGVDFEEIIRARFIKQLQLNPKLSVERDLAGINILHTKAGSGKYPWLQSDNIDDLFLINGKRYIVDYKYPKPGTAGDYQQKGVPFDYQVQLEGYGIGATDKGLSIDGFILAPFDFEHYKAFEVFFNSDPSLQKSIINAGEHYWNNYLLKGLTPDYVSGSKHLSDPRKLSTNSRRLSDELAVLSQLQAHVKDAADDLRRRVQEEIVLSEPQDGTKFTYGLIDATYKEKVELQTAELLKIAESAGVDLTPFIKSTSTTYNLDKLYEHLMKLKDDGYPIDFTEAAIKVKDVSVSVTRAKKGERGELKAGIRQSTEQLVEGFLSMIKDDIKELDPLILKSLISDYDYRNNRLNKVKEFNKEISNHESINSDGDTTDSKPISVPNFTF